MLRWAIDATGLALILAAMQGCGSSSNSGAPDASAGGDAATDGGTADAPVEAGNDCGSTAPTGTQLVKATDPLVVLTMTDDDHVIYENLTTQELYAVATSGGMPSDIGKMTSQGRTVWAHGSTLLYLPIAADPSTDLAPLSAWTPGGGTSVISKSAVALDSYDYTYDASRDGKYVAYFATTNDVSVTLMVSTIDGKTQTVLATGVDFSGTCYPPAVQFVNDTVVAQYCIAPVATADAGTPPETATIAAFTGPSFAPVILGSTFGYPQGPVTVDPTGTTALLPSPSGMGISLYPLAGGNPVTVDAAGTAGLFTSTGDVIYTNSSGSLLRYATATGMATTLSSGLALPLDLSPDGNWLQAASGQSGTTGLFDLYIVSATTPGPAQRVVNTDSSEPFGFTADSQYSLFGSNFPTNFGTGSYNLQASKTSGGTPSKVLAAPWRGPCSRRAPRSSATSTSPSRPGARTSWKSTSRPPPRRRRWSARPTRTSSRRPRRPSSTPGTATRTAWRASGC